MLSTFHPEVTPRVVDAPQADALDALAHRALPYIWAAVLGVAVGPYMFFKLSYDLPEVLLAMAALAISLDLVVLAVRFVTGHAPTQAKVVPPAIPASS